jgi:hypothetical protein
MMKFEELRLLEVGHSIQLAGSVWAGEDKLYIIFLPDEKFDKPFEMMELDVDQWQQFLRQSDLLETEILRMGTSSTTDAVTCVFCVQTVTPKQKRLGQRNQAYRALDVKMYANVASK